MITAEQILAKLEAEAQKVSRETCSKPPLDNPQKLVHMTGVVAGLERAAACISELFASDRKLEDDTDANTAARDRFIPKPAVNHRPAANPIPRSRMSDHTAR